MALTADGEGEGILRGLRVASLRRWEDYAPPEMKDEMIGVGGDWGIKITQL